MGFDEKLIAPCGINCGVCLAYLREKNKCSSCLSPSTKKSSHCNTCRIKLCDEHGKATFTYCFECSKFPCARIKSLDKRYVEKYHLNLIMNSNLISKYGFDEFIKAENEKWKCKHCGEVLCVHRSSCLKCGMENI